MDLIKALRELHAEKKRLDSIIAALEAQITASSRRGAPKQAPRRRGRKSMNAAERLAVSKRMTQYWENRRAQLDNTKGKSEQSNSASAAP